jgi:hypothetical protein
MVVALQELDHLSLNSCIVVTPYMSLTMPVLILLAASNLFGPQMISCDTGAPLTCSGKLAAEQACKKLGVPFELKPSRRSFRFGNSLRESLGTVKLPLPTPDGIFSPKLDVVDLDVPLLIGLDTLDKWQAYVNNVNNSLVGPGWSLQLIWMSGHLYLPLPAVDMLFSRSELAQLHRAFYHPYAVKLYNLIQKAKPQHSDCYGALAMCIIGCAGPPTPSKYRMYHTLVATPAFLVISTIGPSATVLL